LIGLPLFYYAGAPCIFSPSPSYHEAESPRRAKRWRFHDMFESTFLPEGILISSPENKEALSSSAALEKAMLNETVLEARAILCDNELNLLLDISPYRAIIPREEVAWTEDGMPCRDIAIITRVGKAVCFVIDDIIPSDGISPPTLLLSRRRAQVKCIREYLNHLLPGDVIDARITHFEPFGCFCDIGCGIVSLLSIDCISVSRISHPSDRFFVGEFIKAAVKSRDEPVGISHGRISLTHKELLGTWNENAAKFQIGQTVAGIIRSIESYGIFVELAPNLAGLAEWKPGVEVGQIAAVYIKNIIPKKMKVKLVLIDSHSSDKPRTTNTYFITSGNVSNWRYAPDEYEGK